MRTARDHIGDNTNAGAVNVLYSTDTDTRADGGLVSNASPTGDDVWHRASSGVKGDPNTDARFGSALTAADYDASSQADLAIGVPFADVDGIDDAGTVNVLYGSFATMTTDGGLVSNAPPTEDDAWDRQSPGIEGAPTAGDRFGSALG